MNTKTPILDGAAFRMNPKYSCQQCDWAGSDKAERNQHADTTGHLLVLNASEPITASPAVAAVQPLKTELDEPPGHTPGPWRFATDSNGKPHYWIKRGGGFVIARVSGHGIADARLIAAAPELYRAIHRFIEFAKREGDTSWHSKDAQPLFYDMLCAHGKANGSIISHEQLTPAEKLKGAELAELHGA